MTAKADQAAQKLAGIALDCSVAAQYLVPAVHAGEDVRGRIAHLRKIANSVLVAIAALANEINSSNQGETSG